MFWQEGIIQVLLAIPPKWMCELELLVLFLSRTLKTSRIHLFSCYTFSLQIEAKVFVS